MARPALPSQNLKCHTIAFRVTEDEFARLLRLAVETNRRVNDLARTLTLARSAKVRIEGGPQYDPAVVKQLHYIGHNLNQLVRNAHTFGRISPNVERLCFRIEELMDDVISQEVTR